MYRVSDYTLIKQLDNSDIVILNTYTGAVGKIDNILKSKLESENINDQEIDFDTIEILKDNGFIVPIQLNEYNKILAKEKEAIFGKSDTIFLTIATSMKCNYNCKYCFEPINRQDVVPIMDENTANDVIRYIKENVGASVRKLVITWFGGEPLLGLNAIRNITKKIILFCEDNGIEYHAEIITNGYLLTEKIAKMLFEECKVSVAQITIDGPKNIYESIKSTPKGAYRRVLQNIKESSKFLKVDIRLNIPEYYYSNLEEYVDSLMGYLGTSNVRLYLAEVCDDWVDYCGKKEVEKSTYWEQNRVFVEWVKKKYPCTLSSSLLPLAYCGMKCGMIKKQNIVIGAKGELYRCVHMVGRDEEIIGTCTNGFYYNSADSKFNSIEHPDFCHNCIVFPICMTGCPNDIIEGKIRVPCDIKRDSIINDLIKQVL